MMVATNPEATADASASRTVCGSTVRPSFTMVVRGAVLLAS